MNKQKENYLFDIEDVENAEREIRFAVSNETVIKCYKLLKKTPKIINSITLIAGNRRRESYYVFSSNKFEDCENSQRNHKYVKSHHEDIIKTRINFAQSGVMKLVISTEKPIKDFDTKMATLIRFKKRYRFEYATYFVDITYVEKYKLPCNNLPGNSKIPEYTQKFFNYDLSAATGKWELELELKPNIKLVEIYKAADEIMKLM